MTMTTSEIAQPTLTPNLLAVPVDSEIFNAHPDAPYYIGVVAAHGFVLQPELYKAAGTLRANVYIGEKGFLPESARQPDGTERDADDDRSVHFVALENRGPGLSPRVIGTSRLILKRSEHDVLPVENFYPDVFAGDKAAPVRSAEVSRFIARHEDRQVQGKISLGLIRASAAWLEHHVHRPAYAVVEAGLTRMFDNIELPYDSESEYRRLEEYGNTRNKAIKIEPSRVLREVQAVKHVASPAMHAFFGDTHAHKGVGYFDETLTKAV